MLMKTRTPLISLSAGVLTPSAVAQAVEKKVALRDTAAKPPRYATMIPKGGLTVQSRDITNRQVFTLIDANGGDLADGDAVQIKYSDDKITSYWQESGGAEKNHPQR